MLNLEPLDGIHSICGSPDSSVPTTVYRMPGESVVDAAFAHLVA
jgi:hypothetical protein